jgi:hypothetical protein
MSIIAGRLTTPCTVEYWHTSPAATLITSLVVGLKQICDGTRLNPPATLSGAPVNCTGIRKPSSFMNAEK